MIAALLAGALTGALVAGAGGAIVRGGGVVVSVLVMTCRVVVLLWVVVVLLGCVGSQVGACLVSRCKYHVGVVAL